MSDKAPERVDAAVSYSRHDEAAVEPILALLRADGISVWFDKDIPGGALWEEIIARKYRAAGALLFFVSKHSLDSQRCSEEVSTARTLGKPIIPVLLERLKLPDDLPDRFVLTLQARNVVEAYGKPDEEKRRGILKALAAFGIAGTAAGVATNVAEAGSMSARDTAVPQTGGAETSATAKAAYVDPLAKSNAGVVKASSSMSMKTVAFGGAGLATVLVVGAVILMQDRDRDAAPAVPATASQSTASVAKDAREAAAVPDEATPAPAEAAPGAARAVLRQTSYPAGKPIPVRVEGMPGADNDMVSIALAGSSEDSDIRYEYMRGKKSADIVLRAIMKPGNYEVRLFFGSDLGSGRKDKIRFRAPLTITPAAPVTLKMESQRITEGAPLRITYDGMPGNKKDWIATARADGGDDNYISYKYTDGAASGVADMPPFVKPGQYEIRAYFDDLTSDKTVQARIPVEVIPAPPVQLSLDAASYLPGAQIAVTFADMPGNAKDWLALARRGDDGYLTYTYLGGKTSGIATIRAPDEAGAYEIRGYFDDTTGDKTVRAQASFTVGDAAPVPTVEPTPEPQPEATPEPAPETTPETTPDAAPEPPPESPAEPSPEAEPTEAPAATP